ncbi:unnamed protein product [Heterosigma akashiwo]
MSAKKKYTLFKSDGAEGPKPCAFYSTPAGCRNGAKCSFQHGYAPTKAGEKAAKTPAKIVEKRKNSDAAAPKSSNKKQKRSPKPTPKKVDSPKPTPQQPKSKTSDAESEPSLDEEEKGKTEAPTPAAAAQSDESSEDVESDDEGDQEEVHHKPAPKQQQLQQPEACAPAAPVAASSLLSALGLPVTPFNFCWESPPPWAGPQARLREEEEDPEEERDKEPPAGQEAGSGRPLTRRHPKYAALFAFEGADGSWVSPPASLPGAAAVLALDCEMCESEDPVSKAKNEKELVRVSVVRGAAGAADVVLDSLVRPLNTVTDHRERINGIGPAQLAGVQFTLRHAQAALLHLVDSKTLLVGHALHNDLEALRFRPAPGQVVDTALLFPVAGRPGRTPGLKDLAAGVLGRPMEQHHDSVYDARVTFEVAAAALTRGLGPVAKLEADEAEGGGGGRPEGLAKVRNGLLVHRIPKRVTEDALRRVLAQKTWVLPKAVDPIQRRADGSNGKTMVTFASIEHADLAFDAISGAPKPTSSGYQQKRIYLKNPPTYLQVRTNYPAKKK